MASGISLISHDDLAESRVVICDDSITNVMILSKLVESEGIGQVQAFTDPRKLLAHILEHRDKVDLLILDIEMPHMTGIEVMRAIREQIRQVGFSILVLTGLQDKETRHAVLGEGANDFLNKPFDQTEMVLRIRNLLRVQRALRLQSTLAQRLETEVERRTNELSNAVEALVYRLALVGDMRDSDTGLHVARVGRYSRILAEGMDLPPELCFMIEKAAPLHDIGKVGIPDQILHKAGRLDDDERCIINTHAEKGASVLGEHDSMLIQMAASIALSHHERWDGSGYPHKLRGESIPVEGRIVAVSDVFDALTTRRPYKEAWPIEQATEFIGQNAGTHFDPVVVSAFFRRYDDIIAVMKELSD